MSDEKNSAAEAEVAPKQTVPMVLISLDLRQAIHDAMRDLPHRQVDPILKALASAQVADVNIS